jgi:hypothetical protein
MLHADVPAGAVADQHDVVVRVDDARDHGAPAGVDHRHLVAAVDLLPYLDEAAVLDQHLVHHAVLPVHGVDAGVGQHQPLRAVRLARVLRVSVVGRPGRQRQRAGEGQRNQLQSHLSPPWLMQRLNGRRRNARKQTT